MRSKSFQSTLPVGGATFRNLAVVKALAIFQSTLPVGGATFNLNLFIFDEENFNPRSPWGERQEKEKLLAKVRKFQSTLPVGGATAAIRDREKAGILFQSTLPVGGATLPDHSPLEARYNFNPRSPWGERPTHMDCRERYSKFQSTLPVGGATKHKEDTMIYDKISIHAPRGGSDKRRSERTVQRTKFQSTLPVGGATVQSKHAAMTV